MFSQKNINAYKKITVPDELYEKIVNASKCTKRSTPANAIRAIGAVAACFIIAVAVILYTGGSKTSIILNGQELESSILFYDVSPASDMRASPVLSIPLEINVDSDTTIKVSYGKIVLPDGNAVEKTNTTDHINIWWEIPRNEELPVCEMEISSDKEITLVSLTYDNAEKSITATKTVK